LLLFKVLDENMRILFIILFFLVSIHSSIWAVCSKPPTEGPVGTWRTYDASRDCVNDCIQNYASTGETVVVADGDATWTQQIVITKGITFIGGNGTITSNPVSGYLIHYYPNTPANNDAFELYGFTITGRNIFKIQNRSTIYALTKIKIHDNTFTQTSGAHTFEIQGGPVYGVIYNNIFNGLSGEQFDILGAGESSWNNLHHEYGTANNLYIEDNLFYGVDRPIDSGHGGRYVARYNEIHWTTSDTECAFDMHGDGSYGCGTMLAEIYGNDILTHNKIDYLVDQRGAWGLLFYNRKVGSFALYIKVRNDFGADSGVCNHPNNPVSNDINNSYYWNNRNGSGTTATISVSEGAPEKDLDWFTYDPNFDGSGGIGCGTIAEMNATTPTRIGVGFWVTSQSCSSLSDDHVGISPKAPISGILYKWTGSAWVQIFTPYTYPHPLRTSVVEGIPPPLNFKLVN
jgi:hypothetical protein